MTDDCVQLHCHSRLSFKDGLHSPADLVKRAVELGQPGIGLTDHGVLYGAPRFFSACRELDIKGIIGMEAYEAVPYQVDQEYRDFFKEKFDPDKPRYFHLTLWVADQTGWENLCALHTQSFTEDYKPKNQPLIDRKSLAEHNEGLLIGLGCPQSRVNWNLRKYGLQKAMEAAQFYFDIAPGRVYVEAMSALDFQIRMLPDQRALGAYFGAPVLGTNDVHYLTRDEGVLNGAHHTLVQARKWRSNAAQKASSSDHSDDSFGSWYGSPDFYMKTRSEMLQSGILPGEVDCSLEIRDRVDFNFYTSEPAKPVAKIPEPGENPGYDAWLDST